VPDPSRGVGRVGVFGPGFRPFVLFNFYATKTQTLLRHARFYFMKEVKMDWCGWIPCEGARRRTSPEAKKNQRRGRKDGRNPDPSHKPGRIGHPKPKTFGKGCASRRLTPAPAMGTAGRKGKCRLITAVGPGFGMTANAEREDAWGRRGRASREG